MRRFACLLLLFMLSNTLSPSASSLLDFEMTLVNTMSHYNIPGMALAVVSGGEVLLAKGYGLIDCRMPLASGNLVDSSTTFPIASLTKSVTALLLNKIQISYPQQAAILNHKNSMYPHSGDLLALMNYPDYTQRALKLLKYSNEDSFNYQNITFLQLDHLLNTQLYHSQMFIPLEMNTAGFSPGTKSVVPHFLTSDGPSPVLDQQLLSITSKTPWATGLHMSISDAAKYLLEAMQYADDDTCEGYLDGWYVDGNLRYHLGTAFGVESLFAFREDVGVAIFANTSPSPVFPLMQTLFGESYQLDHAITFKEKTPLDGLRTPPPEDMSAFCGNFFNEIYGNWRVFFEDDRLYLALPFGPRMPLSYITDNLFAIDYYPDEVHRLLPGFDTVYFHENQDDIVSFEIERITLEGAGRFLKCSE